MLKNQGIDKVVPVTAIDTHYNEETNTLLLLQGDENGEIVMYDISVILTQVPELTPIDITVNNSKRNPHREFPIEREERKKKTKTTGNDSDDELDERAIPTIVPLVSESEIRTVLKKSPKHKDLIKSIQYISATDRPLILTGSIDRLVHIIDMNSQIVGTLKQGYKTLQNYQWDFRVGTHQKNQPVRQTGMEVMMEDVRKQRDKDLSQKKLLEIRLLKEGKLNSIGFAGN